MKFYMWINKEIVETDNADEWGKWFKNFKNRQIKKTEKNGVTVSTVFLGIDHSFSKAREPVLFETMIFGGEKDGYQKRYCTMQEALDGHNEIMELILK